MGSRDPVDRASRGDSIYEVTDWEPRSAMDRVALLVHRLLHFGTIGALLLSALVITLAIVFSIGPDVVFDPLVVVLIALSVLPALALAAYVRRADVTTSEPLSVLSVTFLLGVLTASFAAVLNDLGMRVVGGATSPVGEVIGLVAFFFLVVGPVEESVKLLAVRLFAYNHDSFDAVIDGAVYGAAAGLGFAAIENVIYIAGGIAEAGGLAAITGPLPERLTAMRALAGPGHVLYSAIAGYYLGLAKFNPQRWGVLVIKGLLVAALFHALYNSTVGVGAFLLNLVLPGPELVAVAAYVLSFQAVVGFYLFRKLERYRRAYENAGAGSESVPAAERTEFEP